MDNSTCNGNDQQAVLSPAPLASGEHPWATSFQRSKRLVGLLELLVSVTITIALIIGPAGEWASSIQSRFASPWLRALAFSAVLAVIYGIPTFPLGFVSGYILEKRYGLSTQTVGDWLVDQLKGAALGAVLGSIVVLGLTAALLWMGLGWWWVTALGAAAFGVVLTRLAPQLIIPLFFKMKPLESPELTTRFSSLARRMGTPILGIFEIDLSRRTRAANAAVVGFGASRRAIVGDTLLSRFSLDEIEFVLAHELGHHHFHDLWSGILIGSAATAASLGLTHASLLYFSTSHGVLVTLPLDFNPIVLFWISVLVSIFGAIVSPVTRYMSRLMESRADRFAAKATGRPLAGADAFRKLGYQNLAVFSPPWWRETLRYTHPCIARRIARLETFKVALPH